MNRNYLLGFAAAAAVLGLMAFIARSLFETYPRTKDIPPSREAQVNQYLALDRWIAEMGGAVRTESYGGLSSISRAEEKRIFIQTSLFQWSDEAVDYLVQWVGDGGNLFISVDNYWSGDYWDNDYVPLLLEKFGIEPGMDEGPHEGMYDDYYYDSESPLYDREISFALVKDEEALLFKDWSNVTRLIQVNRGNGKLTVTGRPFFLRSEDIDRAPNARLAFGLFAPGPSGAEHGGSNGVFFIRGTTKVQGLLGSLFKRGNLAVLAVSVLVLLVVCFWAVIPRFGLVKGDDEKPDRPLRERFLAEGRFLKRYGALKMYRDAYVKEIRRTLAKKEGLSSDDEVINYILKNCKTAEGQKGRRVIEKIFHGEPFTYGDFPKMIIILKGILECI